MAKKASMDTKWKVIGGIIVALIGMGYLGFFFDGCNGEEQPEQQVQQPPSSEKDRPGAVRKK